MAVSPPSAEASATTAASVVPPAVPTGVTSTAASSHTIEIGWTDNSADEEFFQVQRSTDGGVTWQEAGTSDGDEASFVDSRLDASTAYHYRVRAVNDSVESNWSTALAVTTAPPAPGNLGAVGGAGQVALAWDAVPGAANYNVYRSDGTK